MKKVLILSLIIAAFFSSCKKDKPEEPSLKGKWTLETIVTKEYENNALTDTETTPGGGMILDFRENGEVVISNSNTTETFPYTISGSTVNFDGETYEIKNLTSSYVSLYQRYNSAVVIGNYYDIFFNLKR